MKRIRSNSNEKMSTQKKMISESNKRVLTTESSELDNEDYTHQFDRNTINSNTENH